MMQAYRLEMMQAYRLEMMQAYRLEMMQACRLEMMQTRNLNEGLPSLNLHRDAKIGRPDRATQFNNLLYIKKSKHVC